MKKSKKSIGNAVRSKTQIRNSKAKGSQFEYDVLESLQQIYPDMYLTSKQGFQQQYDLRDDNSCIVVECKRHKSISWNQAEKWFKKLRDKAPKQYEYYLIFKSNQQPVLVMYETFDIDEGEHNVFFKKSILVEKFESYFGVPFKKHTPIRKRDKNE